MSAPHTRYPTADDAILLMAERVAGILRGLATDDEILRACEEEYPWFAGGCGVVEYRRRVIDNLASAEALARRIAQ